MHCATIVNRFCQPTNTDGPGRPPLRGSRMAIETMNTNNPSIGRSAILHSETRVDAHVAFRERLHAIRSAANGTRSSVAPISWILLLESGATIPARVIPAALIRSSAIPR